MSYYDFFFELMNISRTAGFVIIAVLILRVILKPFPKKYVCLLWLVVLFRLLCPLTFEVDFSLIPYHDRLQPQMFHNTPQIETELAPVDTILDATVNPMLDLAFSPIGNYYPIGLIADYLCQAWILALPFLILYTFFSWLELRKKLRSATCLYDNIYISDRIPTPFVVGFFRPKIYLPEGLRTQEQKYIVLHERGHIARLDFIVKPVFWCAVMLHSFNPLVWAAWYFYTRDIELACDERAVKDLSPEERKEYSRTLVELAVIPNTLKDGVPCPVAFGMNSIRQRIQYVLNYRPKAKWFTATAICVMIPLVVLLSVNQEKSFPMYEVRDSLAVVNPEIAYTEICWGSAITILTDQNEMHKLWKAVSQLEVKKRGKDYRYQFMIQGEFPYDSQTSPNWIHFYNQEKEWIGGISLNGDCTRIYPGPPAEENYGYLEVQNAESVQQILQKCCNDSLQKLSGTTMAVDLNHDGISEKLVVYPDKADRWLMTSLYQNDGSVLWKSRIGKDMAYGAYCETIGKLDGKDTLFDVSYSSDYAGWRAYQINKDGELALVASDSIWTARKTAEQRAEFYKNANAVLLNTKVITAFHHGELEYSTQTQPVWATERMLWNQLNIKTQE